MVHISALADEWIAEREELAPSRTENTALAHRRDLVRWGEAVSEVLGSGRVGTCHSLDLAAAWGEIESAELTAQLCTEARRVLGRPYVSRSAGGVSAAPATRTFSPATIARMLSTFRRFCGWMVELEHLQVDPTRSTTFNRRPEIPASTPKAFKPEEVALLLKAAQTLPSPRERSMWPARDAAIVSVFARTGIRAAELISLTLADVEIGDQRMLHVRHGTKSGKPRTIPLSSETVGFLVDWLAVRAALDDAALGAAGNLLFCARSGVPLTRSRVDRMLRNLASRATLSGHLPAGAMAHGFRHHFGVQLATRSLPVAMLQESMGHADSRTTAVYTKFVGEELARGFDDAGWL